MNSILIQSVDIQISIPSIYQWAQGGEWWSGQVRHTHSHTHLNTMANLEIPVSLQCISIGGALGEQTWVEVEIQPPTLEVLSKHANY